MMGRMSRIPRTRGFGPVWGPVTDRLNQAADAIGNFSQGSADGGSSMGSEGLLVHSIPDVPFVATVTATTGVGGTGLDAQGNPAAYSWTRLGESLTRGAYTLDGSLLIRGTAAAFPAFERNGVPVAIGTQVLFWPAETFEGFWFDHCCSDVTVALVQKTVTSVCLVTPTSDASVVFSETMLTDTYQDIAAGDFTLPMDMIGVGEGVLLIRWGSVLGGAALVEAEIVVDAGEADEVQVAYGKLQSTGAGGVPLILPLVLAGRGSSLAAGAHTWTLSAKTDATGAGNIDSMEGDTGSTYGVSFETVLAEVSNYVAIPGGVAGTTHCRTRPTDCGCASGAGSGSGSGSGSGGGAGGITSTELGSATTGSTPAHAVSIPGVELAAGDYLIVHVFTDNGAPPVVAWNGQTFAVLQDNSPPGFLVAGAILTTLGGPVFTAGTDDIVITRSAAGNGNIMADAVAVHDLPEGLGDLNTGAVGSASAPDYGSSFGPSHEAAEYVDAAFLLLNPAGSGTWANGFSAGLSISMTVSGVTVVLMSGYQVAAAVGSFRPALTGATPTDDWSNILITLK